MESVGPTSDAIAEQARKLNALWNRIDNLYHETAQRLGVSDTTLAVLYALCELGEGCTQHDICASSWVSKQTVNSCVHKLHQSGLIRFEQGKGKEVRLFATDTGRALMKRTAEPVIQGEFEALASLGDRDARELTRLCALYLDRLQAQLRRLQEKPAAIPQGQ